MILRNNIFAQDSQFKACIFFTFSLTFDIYIYIYIKQLSAMNVGRFCTIIFKLKNKIPFPSDSG
jgi:hypothetical protein